MRSRLFVGISVVAASVASVAALTVGAQPAVALSSITVDSASDGPAVATNCLPTPVPGSCTLRDAFAAASTGGAGAGDDVTITVSQTVTAVTLTDGELAYDGGTGGSHHLTVSASGTTVTQTTGDRVMHSSGTGTFSVFGFTLTGGDPDGAGGAIQGAGDVTVVDSALVGNTASDGGAIDVRGTVTIIRSTLANNTADSFGGAVEGEENEPAVVVNSTISDNTAGSLGGGLAGVGDVTLVYATFADNSAPTGANLKPNGGVLTSFASVIALPQGGGDNCTGVGSTSSQGFNLEDDAGASCGYSTSTGDLAPGTIAGLDALADNGGPGPTRLPIAGSALLDAVPVASCGAGELDITTDERGVTRPQGSGCDIGAVEVAVEGPAPPVAAPLVVTPNFTG